MAEHGIFPPASLQSNDPPKVFSLTLTTAYKRNQFLPLGQRKEMEFFITEWRWGQKVQRMIREATLSSANQNEAALHQKMGSSSTKSQLSCPVAAAQILWVLCREQRAACFFFFFLQASEDFHSEALMSSCPFSMSEYLVFLSYGTYLGPFFSRA